MKKLFITALLAIAITGFAQDKKTTKGQPEKAKREHYENV